MERVMRIEEWSIACRVEDLSEPPAPVQVIVVPYREDRVGITITHEEVSLLPHKTPSRSPAKEKRGSGEGGRGL